MKLSGHLKQGEKTQVQYETIGVLEENRLTFVEGFGSNKTTVLLKEREIVLIRDTDTLKMRYNFREGKVTNGIYYIKELNQNSTVEIKTNFLKKTNQELKIEYMMEEEPYTFYLNWEEE